MSGACLVLAACATVTDEDTAGSPPAEPVIQTDLRPAPIDDVDLRVTDYPPHYVLYVEAGLPSGCASPHAHDLRREGQLLRVTVTNAVLQSDACTMVYGTYELALELGSDFVPGREYAIEVNDERFVFVAQ